MEWLFILGLAAIVGWLWNRLDRVEKQLARMDRLQERTFASLRELLALEKGESRSGEQADAAPKHDGPEDDGPEHDGPTHAPPDPAGAESSATPPRPAARVTVPKTAATGAAALRQPARVLHAGGPVTGTNDQTGGTSTAQTPRGIFTEAKRLIPKISFDFEDIFGRRLPIWGGGVALAIAGVFLVRYAIDAGLLTPVVRVGGAFLFGLLLLAGAETAHRFSARVSDPRISQALAGAGLATLYAGFYLAGTQYGLFGQTLAFLGLAGVTAAAIALSFRFGLPSAVLGLVGGFAAPALVGGEEANLPLLALYLGLVTAGLTVSGRSQRRPWMGIAAMVGGLGWGAILLLADDPGVIEIIALGMYFINLGAVIPALIGSPRLERPLRLGSAIVASLQLALLVEQGGFTPLAWGLYLLMGAMLAFFAWQRSDLREANGVAALVGILLYAVWQAPEPALFALTGTALTAIFAGIPLIHLWRDAGRKIDLWQLCGSVIGIAAVVYGTIGTIGEDRFEPILAIATLALSLFPALAAWKLRSRPSVFDFVIALGTTGLMLFAAMLLVTSAALAPIMGAIVFTGLFALLRAQTAHPATVLLWASAFIIVTSLFAGPRIEPELGRLVGESSSMVVTSMVRWAAIAAVFAALAWRNMHSSLKSPLKHVAESACVVFMYGTLSQLLPEEVLAWSAALLLGGALYALPKRRAAQTTALVITALWALSPAWQWTMAGLASLSGMPVLLSEIPLLKAAVLQILPAATAFAAMGIQKKEGWTWQPDTRWVAVLLTGIVAHVLFKHIFALESVSDFVERGLAERSLWEALLLGIALLAARGLPQFRPNRNLAIGLALAALGHFTLYSVCLHNPLWGRQAVGPVPIANLIFAAYALGVASCLLLRNWTERKWRPAGDGAIVAMTGLGAATLLRQAFAGSLLLAEPVGQTEDLLRSLLGIVLAIGFLLLGAKRGERSWRVGSLVLMLLAVGKVFLWDAAGLEGLLRIASFMALGFSLIGIGWLYSKQLKAQPDAST